MPPTARFICNLILVVATYCSALQLSSDSQLFSGTLHSFQHGKADTGEMGIRTSTGFLFGGLMFCAWPQMRVQYLRDARRNIGRTPS